MVVQLSTLAKSKDTKREWYLSRFEDLLHGQEVGVPSPVLEGVKDEALVSCEVNQNLAVGGVDSDRLLDENLMRTAGKPTLQPAVALR
jgi:hypothetical protein